MEERHRAGKFTRREFVTAAGALTLLATRPGRLLAGLQASGVDQLVVRAKAARRPAVAVPQYDRDLSRVFLSIPTKYLQEHAAAPQTGTVAATYLEHVYDDFIEALPSYTQLLVAVHDTEGVEATRLMTQLARGRSFVLHVIDDRKVELDLWAQDLGEVITIGGEPRFLVSDSLNSSFTYNSQITRDRLAVARTVFGKDAVVQADFVFEGGNVMFDRTASGLRVLIGYNDLLLTMQNADMAGLTVSMAAAATRVSRLFGGAEVVVMGNTRQSPYLPHIDESFVLLQGQVAVVTRLPGTSPEALELARYAEQLGALGYRVLTIDSTVESVQHYEASTNAVPFIDRTTGRRRIIYPVFPSELDPQATGPLTREMLRGKGRQAWEVYASAGYDPLPVRDFAHVVGGASHCISNALE